MSRELNPLEATLLSDLHKVIKASPLLWESYLGLPESHREAVDRQYLDLIDQTIFAALTGAQDASDDKKLGSILEEQAE